MIIQTNPARFNFGILYSLVRTYTDIAFSAAGTATLYANQITSSLVQGNSVFSFNDISLIEGVTYNYTLTATDITTAGTPTPLSLNSAVRSVELPAPVITGLTPTTGTCYFSMTNAFQPANTYQWGYAIGNPAWAGTGSNAATPPVFATCGSVSSCTQSGLAAATEYYFAVRSTAGGASPIGKWSNVVRCRTP